MAAALPLAGQGEKFLSRFKEIWGIDFEFRAPPGERPIPVCMVAREIRSGRLIRLWQDELDALGRPPFDIGPESLTVVYYARWAVFSLSAGRCLPMSSIFTSNTGGRRMA
jgi:hypothetical protein